MALEVPPLLRAAAIAAALALAPSIGAAACNSWDNTVSALGEDYGENLAAEMIDSAGRAIHLFLNAESGTWTLTITAPERPTCLLQSGEGFQVFVGTAAAPEGDPL